MKRVIGKSLMGLLALGLFTGCEKPNEKGGEGGGTATTDYVEKAFGMNLEMVYVEGGTFEMGATAEQGDDAADAEYPVRTIKLDSYYIGKYEVTQAQWKAVMGTTLEEQYGMGGYDGDYGIIGEGDNYPIYYINWDEAQEFCNRLSEKTGQRYMLPTEAQWEYAARGGNKSKHYKYAGSDDIDEVAWYDCDSVHQVGTQKANELGIYDMSGNIEEWCSDAWGLYDESDTDNPNPQTSSQYDSRVARGGCYASCFGCRVSARDHRHPKNENGLGFRVVCIPK